VELEWRANTKPLHTTIDAILTENPSAAPNIASQWFYLALYERDRTAVDRALAVFTEDGCRVEGVPFPNAWCEGTVKRSMNDAAGARVAFQRARSEIQNTLRAQPDYGEALAVLAMADAALGNTKDAIREGRRAVELVPTTKDSINGVLVLQYLAVVYAWSGEKERALEQIRKLMNMPGFLSYGQLRLDPYWDPLQGDPRFQKIISSLAPKKP
jgi:tetratricopeptide (TPR) repeat protein